MKKITYLCLGLPLVLAALAGFESCGSKPPSTSPAATPTAVINFDIQVNPCGTIATLDGAHPATLTGNNFFPSVYTNVQLGPHVIGLEAGGVSISCPETIVISNYSLEVITPCTALSCGNVLPE
jgi:hypothetical protein